MERVFHFDSPRDMYRCDAAIVWCFDNRFHLGFAKYLKRIGIVSPDPIKIAGGAKSLASPGSPSEREFVLDQIRTSMRLHETRLVILMLHSDCGAYGGLAGGFGGDSKLEAQRQEAELRSAAAVVRQEIPEIEVRTCFMDFEGVWEVALEPQAVSDAPKVMTSSLLLA